MVIVYPKEPLVSFVLTASIVKFCIRYLYLIWNSVSGFIYAGPDHGWNNVTKHYPFSYFWTYRVDTSIPKCELLPSFLSI